MARLTKGKRSSPHMQGLDLTPSAICDGSLFLVQMNDIMSRTCCNFDSGKAAYIQMKHMWVENKCINEDYYHD